jgi:hypothetical protein
VFTAAQATIVFSPAAETTASGAAEAGATARGGDVLRGRGAGDVRVSREGGKVDSIDCGSGIDRAVIHAEDNEVNCEDVKVVS